MYNMTTTDNTEEESKRDRFLRLSSKRLKSALEEIRLIENCLSNPYAYQYDYRDTTRIVGELQAAIDKLRHYQRMKLDPDKIAQYLGNNSIQRMPDSLKSP